MLKKTIEYTDLMGEKHKEDFYFHLTKADIVRLNVSKQGGLDVWIQSVINAGDDATIMAEFEKIILSAYGKRSQDGRSFIKSAELSEEFKSSEAYSELFMEMVTDANAASEFVNGVTPEGLADDMAKIKTEEVLTDRIKYERGSETATDDHTYPQILSEQDLREMDPEILRHRLASGKAVIGKWDKGEM